MLAIAGSALLPATARAGTYDVYSCAFGGKLYPNNAWVADGVYAGAPNGSVDTQCGTAGDVLSAALSPGVTLGLGWAGLTFRPPAGATLTDARGTETPLRCNPVTDLGMSLVATGFSYTPGRRAHQGAEAHRSLHVVEEVEEGRPERPQPVEVETVDDRSHAVHYEHGLNPWDWAAGALVAAEAGATVRVPEGFGDAGEITVAAAPGIAVAFNELLAELGANDAAPN